MRAAHGLRVSDVIERTGDRRPRAAPLVQLSSPLVTVHHAPSQGLIVRTARDVTAGATGRRKGLGRWLDRRSSGLVDALRFMIPHTPPLHGFG